MVAMGSKVLIGIILIETLKCKINIGMGTTSYNKYDATHLTYTPLEGKTPSNLDLIIKRV